MSTDNNFIQRLGNTVANLTIRWIPDALVIAVALTLFIYFLALFTTSHGPVALIDQWYAGFWGLLGFSMQMVLIVITGFGLASSKLVKTGLRKIANIPQSGTSAVVITAVVMIILTFIHWGVGLVIGAFLAKEVAIVAKRRGIKVHYPLLAAAGYGGVVVAQSGLSSSAALLVNTPGHFLEDKLGIIPLSETIFQSYNLVYVLGVLIIIPLFLMLMHPKGNNIIEVQDFADESDEPVIEKTNKSPAERANDSKILMFLVVLGGLFFSVKYIIQNGVVNINLNVVNFFFLMLGILLHGSLTKYTNALVKGSSALVGIIIQFPFYAGILGIMASSGLLAQMATLMVKIATPETYAVLTMFSAAIINLAVPSGGGQWAIQGPIAVQAAADLNVPSHLAVMSVMMGDAITNLIQPFWALPLLGITGLRVGQVLGYTALLTAIILILSALSLYFLGM